MTTDGSALSDFSALDPLLDFDYRDLPEDIPKDVCQILSLFIREKSMMIDV
jgi:hypothetical protein